MSVAAGLIILLIRLAFWKQKYFQNSFSSDVEGHYGAFSCETCLNKIHCDFCVYSIGVVDALISRRIIIIIVYFAF